MAHIEIDEDVPGHDPEEGLIGAKVIAPRVRNREQDFRHLTPFAILAFLTFGLFVAVIVMQVLEIQHLQEMPSIWPNR